MAQPQGKYSLEPVYNGRSYEDEPKIRGVIWSLLIALFCWIIASVLVAILLVGVGELWIYLLDGHFYKMTLENYIPLLMLGLLWEFIGHGTMLVGFWCARTWPSLIKVILYSIFGSRYARSGASITKISLMTD